MAAAVGKTIGARLAGALVANPPPTMVEIVVREPTPLCTATNGMKLNVERKRAPTRRNLFIAVSGPAAAPFCHVRNEMKKHAGTAMMIEKRNTG
ncbi:MAG TPA: hypothetical protein PLD20_31105 [Blastocatellia bacterium]|nr:hypothetical protein [Blastocatellia bacterium]HMX27551.1 hypothetical protein [Blastocatellia bacterium]HMY71224.1 hypothetical protein [Blastocatellia bacterium]HMZ22420.1 hypothetical protein [Blastocatellia bacterium]